MSTDMVAWLTAAELRNVTQGLLTSSRRTHDARSDEDSRPEGSRAVRLFAYAFPGAPDVRDNGGS